MAKSRRIIKWENVFIVGVMAAAIILAGVQGYIERGELSRLLVGLALAGILLGVGLYYNIHKARER